MGRSCGGERCSGVRRRIVWRAEALVSETFRIAEKVVAYLVVAVLQLGQAIGHCGQ